MSPTRRLVAVSNRLPVPNDDGSWPAGGLVSALLPALQASGGLWLGWSGEYDTTTACADGLSTVSVTAAAATGEVTPRGDGPRGAGATRPSPIVERHGAIELAALDLTPEEHRGYYEGFANETLWPHLHGLPDRACDLQAEANYATYRSVNRRFAEALVALLHADDVLWVHDYHLIPLAAELRDLGWRGPIGYFHHIPVPGRRDWKAIPFGTDLAAALGAYDLRGVQTPADAERLRGILPGGTGAPVDAYPVPIYAPQFRAPIEDNSAPGLDLPDDGRLLIAGVDRLDYTKAIPERLQAFELLLERRPELVSRVRYVQWAPSSRDGVWAYRTERAAIERAAERIECRFGGADVLRLDLQSHPPEEVAALLARADVGLVTPRQDGMNLVAKEYSAVHSFDSPGVLVLGQAAGASAYLDDALLVDGNDPRDIAAAMERAIDMPDAERRRRAARLRARVDSETPERWTRRFVEDLTSAWGASRRRHPRRAAVHRRPVRDAGARRTDEGHLLPGWLERRLRRRLELLHIDDVVHRIHERDGSLWAGDPGANAARLGWLSPESTASARRMAAFAERTREAGYTSVVLIGTGGSSQAAGAFATLARARRLPGLRLVIADSTVPAAIRDVEAQVDPGRTLFIASSKSGGTLETRALLEHFWRQHPHPTSWIAITDPGTALDELARERGFAEVFHGHEDIGGRFSALSPFGLVPAALLGLDIQALLRSARVMRSRLHEEAGENPGARLGATLAESALAGHDVPTLALDDRLTDFGGWLTQLLAESTGKEGTGLLPVSGEPLSDPAVYSGDRLFVAIGGASDHGGLDRLAAAGYPVLRYAMETDDGIGGEMLRWEFATAVAGQILGINPFDQPDVEGAKHATQALLDGRLESCPLSSMEQTLSEVSEGSYVAIHAYLPRRAEVEARLRRIQLALRDRLRVPVTVEYAPGLLHSTGQYHKGGPARGVIVQVMEHDIEPITVPGRRNADDRPVTFEAIKNAQADADAQMLLAHGQRVARCNLTELVDVVDHRLRRLGARPREHGPGPAHARS